MAKRKSKNNTNLRMISNVLLLVFVVLVFITLCTPMIVFTQKSEVLNTSVTTNETGGDVVTALFTDEQYNSDYTDGANTLNSIESNADLEQSVKAYMISYIATLILAGAAIICLIMRMIRVHVSLVHFLFSTAFFCATIITFIFSIIVASYHSATFMGLSSLYSASASIGFGSIFMLICGLGYATTYLAFRRVR